MNYNEISHALRAPLTALEAAAEDLTGLPEARQKLLRDAILRLRKLAEDVAALDRAEYSARKAQRS